MTAPSVQQSSPAAASTNPWHVLAEEQRKWVADRRRATMALPAMTTSFTTSYPPPLPLPPPHKPHAPPTLPLPTHHYPPISDEWRVHRLPQLQADIHTPTCLSSPEKGSPSAQLPPTLPNTSTLLYPCPTATIPLPLTPQRRWTRVRQQLQWKLMLR